MKPGDQMWGWTCPPERANPHHPPVRVELVDSREWDGRILWRCREVETGSQWDWQQEWLSVERDPCKRLQPGV